ncbi:MAG: radical SAM protein [Methanomicrobiales archaeon]|nr:radical SAM protein [Methanomicrobiales archaeon]
MMYRYLFGPVPSRRLGVSLGIDLVPLKVCSFNCIFCECGRTTDLTVERREYVPTAAVIRELDDYLRGGPHLDYITFSGSGEPTLHAGIGAVISHIRAAHPSYRIALLTNGSLFSDPAVRKDVRGLDLIIPSLNAVSPGLFARINRPHASVTPEGIIDGLVALRGEFCGELWLEIFIIPGINDTPEEIALLSAAVGRIRPDRVQLNTLDRPGAVGWVQPASQAVLDWIAAAIDHPAVEVVGRPSEAPVPVLPEGIPDLILGTLRRRPCTLDDLARICGLRASEVRKYCSVLVAEGKISEKTGDRGIFYTFNP